MEHLVNYNDKNMGTFPTFAIIIRKKGNVKKILEKFGKFCPDCPNGGRRSRPGESRGYGNTGKIRV